jgi:hypothetical protein
MPLQKVAFCQLEQCQIAQGLTQEQQHFTFPSVSPFTTKHSDRHTLNVAPIIYLFMFERLLASNLEQY